MASTAEKRAAFRALHEKGCFALPNPWDVGSARMLEHLGFKALASTSSGFAWTQGRPDYGVARADALAHLAALCRAVNLPINADFESGFADGPAGRGRERAARRRGGRRRAFDRGPQPASRRRALRPRDGAGTAARRPRRHRAAAGDACSSRARRCCSTTRRKSRPPSTRSSPSPRRARTASMRRACASPTTSARWCGRSRRSRSTCWRWTPPCTLAEYADLGVRRVSVGGSLARVGWAAALQAAQGPGRGLVRRLERGRAVARAQRHIRGLRTGRRNDAFD